MISSSWDFFFGAKSNYAEIMDYFRMHLIALIAAVGFVSSSQALMIKRYTVPHDIQPGHPITSVTYP